MGFHQKTASEQAYTLSMNSELPIWVVKEDKGFGLRITSDRPDRAFEKWDNGKAIEIEFPYEMRKVVISSTLRDSLKGLKQCASSETLQSQLESLISSAESLLATEKSQHEKELAS